MTTLFEGSVTLRDLPETAQLEASRFWMLTVSG
jgi:hypothetical protein